MEFRTIQTGPKPKSQKSRQQKQIKMNKKLFFAAVIVIASLASSCKRESKLIVGTWKNNSDDCSTATTTFKDDGTWTAIDPCDSLYQNSNGNYNVDKDQLTVTDAAFPIPFIFTIEDIDKSSMTLNLGGALEKYTKVN